ncbi:MAG: phosphopyruvate hydratase [Patescibacteria group bacterium]|nr:phosphopyruvate hydratase [Patescibacteria group bacterium]
MAKIKQIFANEIIDSRGNPTVEATVVLSDGATGSASSPSGASVGSYEAVEIRDHDEKRYKGLGVIKAIDNIQKVIAPAITGIEATKQQEIDRAMIELDGTQNKGRLGANSILPVSMAVCKAAAKSSVLPLFLYIRQFVKRENIALRIPNPLFNLINGGAHAAGNNLDIQEFLLIPATSKLYSESLEIGVSIYHELKNVLKQKGFSTLVGDEGGFGPDVSNNLDALLLLKDAIDQTQYKFGFDVFFGLDAAANSFYKNKQYQIKDKSMALSSDDLISYYIELNKQFNFLYLEDPLSEDDWEAWEKISTQVSKSTIVVGDDLTVTNPYRLQMAIDKKAISGIIIKPNQIGTVIEALAVVEVARAAGLKIIVSHRSGETTDDFIADFSVAASADYVKFGAPARGERVVKYNRLLQIEKQIKTISQNLGIK